MKLNGIIAVLKRNFLYSKYTWVHTFLWTFIEPILYLVAIGYGLGAFIPEIEGQSYLDFYFPGLIAITAMFVPFFESTYTYYSKLRYEKTYQSILLSPISVSEILMGEILWATFRGFFSGTGVALIGWFLGLITGYQIMICLGMIFMIAFTFSALGMLFTTFAKNYDYFYIVFSGLILPMSLFSDTYFPYDKYPEKIQGILNLFPSFHGVRLLRLSIHPNLQNHFMGETWLHVIFLIIFGAVITTWSYRRLRKLLLS